jgi:hypothetical protein
MHTSLRQTQLRFISRLAFTTLQVGKPSSDARFRFEGEIGLADYPFRLGSDGVIVCRFIGIYSFARVSWFTRSSRLPRPASPASTSKVETVHPQYG